MAGIGSKILGFLTGGFAEKGIELIGKVVKDKDLAEQLSHEFRVLCATQENELAKLAAETEKEVIERRGDVIKTEAASSHWLAANWRPITMLVFVGLIVARWFGFAAPDLAEDEYLALWDIVQLGLGGYVIGRSVEKIAPWLIRGREGG
jgi:hypothetical protein